MENCNNYDPQKRICLECDVGYSPEVNIKEIITSTPSNTAAKLIDPKMKRILESLDTTDQKISDLSKIDDSGKDITFEEESICVANPDIPSCLVHSANKKQCLLCDTGQIYNSSVDECQTVILVDRGCLKYGPYNSCYRCMKDYYLNDTHGCVPVINPISNCHLYNIFEKCSLCSKGFALSKDKSK
jgi:hypothetical protein